MDHPLVKSSSGCVGAFKEVAVWSVLSNRRRGKSPNVTMMRSAHQILELMSPAHLSGVMPDVCTDKLT